MALEKRISELTAKVGTIEDTDLLVISDYNGVDYDTKKVTGAQINPYKLYLANISQTGTSAPTVNSSYSQLTSTITFSRTGVGTYELISSEEFTVNKTFIQITNGANGNNVILGASRFSSTTIRFYSSNLGTLTDALLDNCQIEIKIIK